MSFIRNSVVPYGTTRHKYGFFFKFFLSCFLVVCRGFNISEALEWLHLENYDISQVFIELAEQNVQFDTDSGEENGSGLGLGPDGKDHYNEFIEYAPGKGIRIEAYAANPKSNFAILWAGHSVNFWYPFV